MFKKDDDLRQDQLITKIFQIFDKILKSNNLDLCLSPYLVMPTSINSGFVELVPNSFTIEDIIKKHKNIQNYLQFYNPNKFNNGIQENVLDNYIKSCAGYSVITYILQIGDRHLENLLLTTGFFFFFLIINFIFYILYFIFNNILILYIFL
jgi:phosphatidylinositol 3-kinase